jgi:putative membrane protein
MKFLINILATTIAVFVVSQILPGVILDDITSAFIVAVVLGVLNTFVKPVIKILTLPITILTLGLFSMVINIALLYLTDYLVKGLTLTSFLTVVLFGFLVSVISSLFAKV